MSTVQFVEMRESSRQICREDRYELGKGSRIVRAAVRWLLKHGYLKSSWDEAVTTTHHVIETDKLLDVIFRERREAARFLGRDATQLFIGADDYMELIGDASIRSYVHFPAHAHDRQGMFGLTVHIVPWMRGVLVAP